MPADPLTAIVIGGGPAGLMAAEALAGTGVGVAVYESMPSVARKMLLAGKGGLNLTHSEPLERFATRYGPHAAQFAALLAGFGPQQLREWAGGLGIDTFIGSSGRVFPTDFKAAPLARAWMRRLRSLGVTFHVRHRWLGWAEDGALRFSSPDGEVRADADATILALGGASWPRLGSDGGWVPVLRERGVSVAPLAPANCGFDLGWSEPFRERFAGQPLKTVTLSFAGRSVRGDVMLTATGIEGGPVYALSAALREAIARDGRAVPTLDLKPDWPPGRLRAALARPRGSRSLSTWLGKVAALDPVRIALLREAAPEPSAEAIKALPLVLTAPRPLAEAISTAGGVRFDECDGGFMLTRLPGVFVAGEMLDWEAPTGGYLLTGCFATGRAAGLGAAEWLSRGR